MHDLDELDELAHHVDRMQSLLSDRHPGLSTWAEALCEHWQAVADIAEGEYRSWLKDWPTEPGEYWFYGISSGGQKVGHRPRLHLVNVYPLGDRLVMLMEGNTYWQGPRAPCGCWKPARTPRPPEEQEDENE